MISSFRRKRHRNKDLDLNRSWLIFIDNDEILIRIFPLKAKV